MKYFAVGEVIEHNGSLSVISSLHPQIELDALEVGTQVYIQTEEKPVEPERPSTLVPNPFRVSGGPSHVWVDEWYKK